MEISAKSKALKEKKKFSYHDLRTDKHRDAPYSEVRSALKSAYGKNSNKVSSQVRQYAQDLKPNTSEGIPAKGGYYHRTK